MNTPQAKKVSPKPALPILTLAILGLAAGLWAGLTFMSPAPDEGRPSLARASLLPQPKLLGPFQLRDHRQQEFSLASLEGHWTFLVFGYASCPDVCPTTLALLSQVERLLSDQAQLEDTQFIFVSVDPERDTLERLGSYVDYFNPVFLGATGTKNDIDRLSRQLGVMYAKVADTDSALGYLVDHTASIMLVDPEAHWHAVFSPPHEPNLIHRDFLRIKELFASRR